MNPIVHANRSAKTHGGKPEDYLPIHEFIDSSRFAMADNRHRFLTHNQWFIYHVLPKVFGQNITNSSGRKIGTTIIGEEHVLQDFRGFIPTVQDFIENMPYENWMQNGAEKPPSVRKLRKEKRVIKWKN